MNVLKFLPDKILLSGKIPDSIVKGMQYEYLDMIKEIKEFGDICYILIYFSDTGDAFFSRELEMFKIIIHPADKPEGLTKPANENVILYGENYYASPSSGEGRDWINYKASGGLNTSPGEYYIVNIWQHTINFPNPGDNEIIIDRVDYLINVFYPEYDYRWLDKQLDKKLGCKDALSFYEEFGFSAFCDEVAPTFKQLPLKPVDYP